MSHAAASPSLFDKNRRRFILRKLHSLSGVVPLGLFVVFHLFTNARALSGESAFQKAVAEIQATPYLPLVESVVVLGPLLFHALYGIVIAFEARPNVGTYPFNRNWMYTAQRVTGIVAFAFITWHLSEYWVRKVTGHLAPEQFYGALCHDLSSVQNGVPIKALAYIFGIAAVVFHLANGLTGFCFSWGITVTRRSQRLAATVFGILGVVVFLLGANTAIYFATAARVAIFGTPAESPIARVRSCPEVMADQSFSDSPSGVGADATLKNGTAKPPTMKVLNPVDGSGR